MTRKKRIYDTEFKEKAIALSFQRENLKELADELGVNVERIFKWRRGHRLNEESNLVKKPTQTTVNTEEFKQLRKELKDTQLELEILKKAIHIFSKSNGKNTNL